MQSKRLQTLFVAVFALALGFLTVATPLFAASKEKVLYSFNGKDGWEPDAGLIFDAAGSLYTTTAIGGASGTGCGGSGCGIVFQLTPGANGKWTKKVLHSFDGTDGSSPLAGLIFDAAGNLYSTTAGGGSGSECSGGCGTVFQLAPGANGKWTEKVLHSFDGTDGSSPLAGLIFDAAGNLYGTTAGGGSGSECSGGCGTVFQLAPGTNGKWTKKVLHSFNGTDGSHPDAGLIFDAAGNLYGTTAGGGSGSGCSGGCGTVFQLAPGANGKWTEKVLHSFDGTDGSSPLASLIFDAAGNLYGTTYNGGASGTGCGGGLGCGTVFRLTPGANGKWTEKVLHSFGKGKDGYVLGASLIFDATGNLYGTTTWGGPNGFGTVFQLTPGANGKWAETVLYGFQKDGKNGSLPGASLIFDAAGNLYSTTEAGGGQSDGVVFEITP